VKQQKKTDKATKETGREYKKGY